MKKDKTQAQATTQAQAQAQEQATTQVVETLTTTEQLRNKLFSLIPMNNLKAETVKGKEVELYEFSYNKKTKQGETATTVQIRDKYAIATMLDIDTFTALSTMSLKGLCIAMARLTKQTAEKAGFKSVVDMVSEKHTNLSKNTLQKYRRIGLLFGDISEDGYMWRSFIPQSVSVSNLDVVLTLFDKVDVEALTQEKLEERCQKFYEEYIVTDKISLTATQKKLKEQVHLIKNPPIDVKTVTVNDNEQAQEQSTQDNDEPKQDTPETQAQEQTETVRLAISTIAEYYKNNPKVSPIIMELIKAIEQEQEQETESK